MISHILFVYIYKSFKYRDIFYDYFVILFQLNFDIDDFSFEFEDDV